MMNKEWDLYIADIPKTFHNYWGKYIEMMAMPCVHSHTHSQSPISLSNQRCQPRSYMQLCCCRCNSAEKTSVCINDDTISKLYARSYELHDPPVNEQTFYIHTLPKRSLYKHQTLVFYIHGLIVCTHTPANTLIQNYLRENGLRTNPLKYLAPDLGYNYKFPVIVGEKHFAPDRGTSKQQANWIGLHHVKGVKKCGKGTLFRIRGYHEVIMDISPEAADKMIEKTKEFSYAYRELWRQIYGHLYGTSTYPQMLEDCILADAPVKKKVKINSANILKRLMIRFILKVLWKVLGEGNPHRDKLEEIIEDMIC